MKRQHEEGKKIRGLKIYRELAEEYTTHPAQSWRDRTLRKVVQSVESSREPSREPSSTLAMLPVVSPEVIIITIMSPVVVGRYIRASGRL